jgi:hypothetical protein
VKYIDTLDLFVACSSVTGASGTQIMTSPTGSTWTLRTTPTPSVTNAYPSIVYSPEIGLIVCGSSGFANTTTAIMTSQDAITWTLRSHTSLGTSGQTRQLRAGAWSPELGLFVFAGWRSNTTAFTLRSTDGINWTLAELGGSLIRQWQDLIWVPEHSQFVAVANFGTGNRVMTSPDGVNWTSRTTPVNNSWESVTYSSDLDLYAAVSANGSQNRVMTSPDGITWTSRTTPATEVAWQRILWSPCWQLFVVVGHSGRHLYSSDGITWTNSANMFSNNWQGLAWADELGIFCAVSSSGTGNRVQLSNITECFSESSITQVGCDFEAYQEGVCSDFEVY